MTELDGRRDDDEDAPDPRLLWRWAARATRPWAGWVFIGLGALLVLLGYIGVSGEAVVEKQLPFLVSGGIGGVLLCIVGIQFIFLHVLLRQLRDARKEVASWKLACASYEKERDSC